MYPETVDGALSVASALEKAWRLPLYAEVVEQAWQIDVSLDARFQRQFNRFFVVRRNATWREEYYAMFEREKREAAPNFERVVRELYGRTGSIEASFASKMVAVLDPNMPIWDSIVLKRLGLKPRMHASAEVRLTDATRVYGEICQWYERYLPTRDAAENLALFDRMLPKYASFTPTKKIDFLLWGAQ